LPADVELPAPTAKTVEAFRAAGGRVLTDSNENGKRLDVAALTDAIQPRERLSPSQEKIAMGRFTRDGRTVLLLVNVGTEPYDGKLSVGTGGAWLRMDPVTGSVESVNTDGQTVLPLALASRQTVLLVSP
jgi:hypothetical protein